MIVIPMAGASRRFAEAGHDRPKYMLAARGDSLFHHAVASFRALFDRESFLFIARDIAGTADFIAGECAALGLKDWAVEILPGKTDGQAATVAAGLAARGLADTDTPVTIFNIDTFRPGFQWPGGVAGADGWLEVFRGGGDNWSFVRPGPDHRVLETAEKRPLSDLCCTGLYHFARARDFMAAFADPPPASSTAERRERYVAPLYNRLIVNGADIRYVEIPRDAVIFCGVPAEYDAFRSG